MDMRFGRVITVFLKPEIDGCVCFENSFCFLVLTLDSVGWIMYFFEPMSMCGKKSIVKKYRKLQINFTQAHAIRKCGQNAKKRQRLVIESAIKLNNKIIFFFFFFSFSFLVLERFLVFFSMGLKDLWVTGPASQKVNSQRIECFKLIFTQAHANRKCGQNAKKRQRLVIESVVKLINKIIFFFFFFFFIFGA
jgi:hypothetical protein